MECGGELGWQWVGDMVKKVAIWKYVVECFSLWLSRPEKHGASVSLKLSYAEAHCSSENITFANFNVSFSAEAQWRLRDLELLP